VTAGREKEKVGKKGGRLPRDGLIPTHTKGVARRFPAVYKGSKQHEAGEGALRCALTTFEPKSTKKVVVDKKSQKYQGGG